MSAGKSVAPACPTSIPKIRDSESMQLTSTLRCPHCGHQSEEQMPTDACLFFFRCPGCQQLLRPREGDCCVFCSYGTIACPPVQEQGRCC